MRFAVGKPGQPVRAFFLAEEAEVEMQLRPGEIMVATELMNGAATISADGFNVTADSNSP